MGVLLVWALQCWVVVLVGCCVVPDCYYGEFWCCSVVCFVGFVVLCAWILCFALISGG